MQQIQQKYRESLFASLAVSDIEIVPLLTNLRLERIVKKVEVNGRKIKVQTHQVLDLPDQMDFLSGTGFSNIAYMKDNGSPYIGFATDQGDYQIRFM
jgi:2',3'-cyclic-nucleotide 2'-phosphodiesterase (5'-nucleotidase family)